MCGHSCWTMRDDRVMSSKQTTVAYMECIVVVVSYMDEPRRETDGENVAMFSNQ